MSKYSCSDVAGLPRAGKSRLTAIEVTRLLTAQVSFPSMGDGLEPKTANRVASLKSMALRRQRREGLRAEKRLRPGDASRTRASAGTREASSHTSTPPLPEHRSQQRTSTRRFLDRIWFSVICVPAQTKTIVEDPEKDRPGILDYP